FHIVADVKASHAGEFLGFGDSVVGQMGGFFVHFDFDVLGDGFLASFGFLEGLFGFGVAAPRGGDEFGVAGGVFLVPFGALEGAFGGVKGLLDHFPGAVDFDDLSGDRVGGAVLGGVVVGGAADDQGGARFVDQDRIHFVDDDKIQRTLHLEVDAFLHIVAEIVEAEFAVGS